MNIRECYQKFNGDYDDVKGRLGSDSLVEKFMLKFLNDQTYSSLEKAVSEGNIAESFRNAHTLKGIAANLSFTELCENVSKLTEQLRPQTEPADSNLYSAVETSYSKVVSAVNEYSESK